MGATLSRHHVEPTSARPLPDGSGPAAPPARSAFVERRGPSTDSVCLSTVTTSEQAGPWAEPLGTSENLTEASLQREPDPSDAAQTLPGTRSYRRGIYRDPSGIRR